MPVPTPMMETALILPAQSRPFSRTRSKPEYTEDELKDPTKTPDGTPVEGTPEPQDHNNVTPPLNSPPPTPVAACLVSIMFPTQAQIKVEVSIVMEISILRLA